MRYALLLLALAATAALLSPCLYSINYLAKDNTEKLVEVDTLNTSVFDLIFMDLMPAEWDDPLVTVKGVCHIGPYWDYTVYQMSDDNFLKTLRLLVYRSESEIFTPNQREFVKAKKYYGFEVDIHNNKWTVGKSSFETVFLSRNPTDDIVYLVGGPRKVLKNLKLQLSSSTSPKFHETPSYEANMYYLKEPFPTNYACVFRTGKDSRIIHMRTSSELRVMEKKDRSEITWMTVQTVDCWNAFDSRSYSTISNEKSGKQSEKNERRVYVKNDIESANSIFLRQNNLRFWVTVISKPYNLLQQKDMSEFAIVSKPFSLRFSDEPLAKKPKLERYSSGK